MFHLFAVNWFHQNINTFIRHRSLSARLPHSHNKTQSVGHNVHDVFEHEWLCTFGSQCIKPSDALCWIRSILCLFPLHKRHKQVSNSRSFYFLFLRHESFNQLLKHFCSAEIAKEIHYSNYGLIFGFNTCLALSLHHVLSVIVKCLKSDPFTWANVNGGILTVLAFFYFVLILVYKGRSGKVSSVREVDSNENCAKNSVNV